MMTNTSLYATSASPTFETGFIIRMRETFLKKGYPPNPLPKTFDKKVLGKSLRNPFFKKGFSRNGISNDQSRLKSGAPRNEYSES
jgi:hypothetical protein